MSYNFGKLCIVRHSLRDDDANPHLYSGSRNNNVPISDAGIVLGLNTKKKLDSICQIDLVYTSPFKRARQTAELLVDEIDIYENALLSEGQNKKPPNFSEELYKILKDHYIEYPETIDQIENRCKKFVDNIIKDLKKGKNVLVVTHGIIYNYLLKYIFPSYEFDDVIKSSEYVPRCCDLSVITYNNAQFQVLYTDVENLKSV